MALKKVLIISDTYSSPKYPAKGLFVKNQALCLLETGKFQIDILFIERKSNGLVKCFSIYLGRLFKHKIQLDEIESLENFRVLHVLFPINRRVPDRILLWVEKYYIILISKFFERKLNIPNLIHAHSGLSSGIFSNWLCSYFEIPFVITEHSPLLFHFVSKQRSEKVIDSFKKASKVASLTCFQDQLLKRYYSNVKSEIIPNLINQTNFYIDHTIDKEKVFTVISVLNLCEHKSRDILFKSFKILNDSKFNFRFILIGEGTQKMEKECEELGVSNLGKFYFNIQNKELYKFYNISHLFVSSSIYESHGMAAREAMLCGLPVVTTDNGGIVDSINEETGLIVSVQDPKALAMGIEKVYENYNQYSPIKIREQIIKECGTESFKEKMNVFYNISD